MMKMTTTETAGKKKQRDKEKVTISKKGKVSQEVKDARFIDTRHMKVVKSSPLRTGRLYPQEYPGTHF
jgi:hypothetical protein